MTAAETRLPARQWPHWTVLRVILRYLGVAALALLAWVLFLTSKNLLADEPASIVTFQEHEYLLYAAIAGLTALLLAVPGHSWKWLVLAAVIIITALVLYPIARGAYNVDAYFRDVNQAFWDSFMLGLAGAVSAVVVFPASYLGHRRLSLGGVWFLGWLVVSLLVTAYAFLHEGLTAHFAGHQGYTAASFLAAALAVGMAAAAAQCFRASRR